MTDTQPTAVLESGIETDVASSRPRIRWAPLFWGLIVLVAVGWTLSIVGSPTARDGFVDWVTGLGVGGAIVVGVIALGALIVLQGVIALLKLTQKPRG